MSLSLPIPEPRAEDDEDVHWALSTASALWARGEPQEALKWLRRAAETASDANRDERSLELFKAAAEFANGLQAKQVLAQPAQAQDGQQSKPFAPPPLPLGSRPPAPPNRPPSMIPAITAMDRPSVAQPSTSPLTPASPGVAAPRGQPPARGNRAHPPPVQTSPASPPPPLVHAAPPGRSDPSRPQATGTIIQRTSPAYTAMQQQSSAAWAQRNGAPAGPFQPVPTPNSEVLASTVPHPSQPPVTDVDAALRAMDRTGKTLASNASYEDLADDSPRRPARSSKPAEPRAKRRATRDGRKTYRGEVSLEIRAATRGVPLAVPSPNVAIHEARDLQPDAAAQTPRVDPAKHPFTDEGTLERHATLAEMQVDLEEQTNVLTGTEANVVLEPDGVPATSKTITPIPSDPWDADARDTSDSTPLSESQGLVAARPPTERPPPQEVALRALSAYRVALHRPPQGGLEVKLLAPGEPTPSGRIGALLTPVDAMSSAALFDLLSSKR